MLLLELFDKLKAAAAATGKDIESLVKELIAHLESLGKKTADDLAHDAVKEVVKADATVDEAVQTAEAAPAASSPDQATPPTLA